MRTLLPVMVLALCAGVAQADNGVFYIGAGLPNDNLDDIGATNSSLHSTGWKVWAAVRPISLFAIEADFIDLGTKAINYANPFVAPPIPAGSTHLQYKTFAGYAVGYLPLPVPSVDVFGKVGIAHWTLTGNSTCFGDACFTSPLSDNGTQFAWGAGAQVHFGNFGTRLEYENLSIRHTGGANLVSLSVFLNLF